MKKTLLIISVSFTMMLSHLTYGGWTLVSDFNDASGLDVVTDVTNQEGSNARTEIIDGRLAAYPGVALENTSNLFAGINLGTDIRAKSIELDGPITVYFQLIQPTVSDGQGGTRKAIVDTVFGMTHFGSLEWTTETYNAYNAMARINFGNDSLEVRDDTSYVPQDNGVLAADTVYEIWMEVDFAFNEWQGYVKGGQFSERTKLIGTDGNEFLGFRKIPGFEADGTTPQKVENLLIALSRGNIAAEKGQDPTYFDNVYIDLEGVNSTSPAGGWQLIADFSNASDLDKVTDVTNQEGSNARTEIIDGRLAAYPGVALENTSNLFAGINLGADIRAASIELDGPVTVYFELIQPTVSDGQGGTRKAIVDTVFGMTHFGSLEWTTETYNSYNAMARINFGNDSLEVRDDTSYVAQDNGVLAADTVYKIWMEVDYAFNEWQGYVQGGQFTERTKLIGTDGNEFLGFRKIPGFEVDGTTPQTVENLLIALSRGNIAAEKGQDPTYFDNFYIDLTGANSSSPSGGGGDTGDSWAGYPVLPSGDCDTGTWLGWVNVVSEPWVWSYSLNGFIYVEESGISSSGGWIFFPK